MSEHHLRVIRHRWVFNLVVAGVIMALLVLGSVLDAERELARPGPVLVLK